MSECKTVGGPHHSHVMYVIYVMWYFREHTKTCAYDFILNVLGTFGSKGNGRHDCIASTRVSALMILLLL